MTPRLQPVCARYAQCKCCGALAVPYGVVDFHKNCEDRRRRVLDLSGVPIYYHRCPACRFIFTTAFDRFTNAELLDHIYNEEYLLVDPDYRESRARGNADMLCRMFSIARPSSILDYGGGNGVLAEALHAAGFADVETYDPFVPRYATRPSRRFDCVVCFEVVEHATDPASVFADMDDLLTYSGLIIFSTLLQPPDIDQAGLSWWYAAPRNGHVSLFSRPGLELLVRRFGFQFGSFDQNLHALFREVPDFAEHFIRPAPSVSEVLCTPSVPEYY
jgi:2-polyprenyl-6-hydroxyphenyl methylase/3-demethylubiquinone-9 3-methyltransferase